MDAAIRICGNCRGVGMEVGMLRVGVLVNRGMAVTMEGGRVGEG